jgi:HAMP domain-containing protein
MRWRTKLLLLLLAFAVAPMVVVALLALDTLERTARESTLHGLQAVARAKAQAIDQFTENRLADVERMAGMVAPRLQRLRAARNAVRAPGPPVDQPLSLEDAEKIGVEDPTPPSPIPQETPPEPRLLERNDKLVEEGRAELSETLGLLLWDQRQFEELLIIAPDGVVLASTFDDHIGRSAAELEYFRSGRRAAFVQPVFMSPITEQLTMMIATPIRDEHRATIGVFAARLSLTGFFRLINDYTGLGASGETVVAKKIGDEVVFMAPTRHDATAALNRKVAIGADVAISLQDAARGQAGSGLQDDYRGVSVFAAWRYVPALDWGLVTKIDYREAVAAVQSARTRTVVITLAVLVLLIGTSIVASQALVAPLKQLRDATERISKGDFDVELDIRSDDEIGELADSFERMVAAIKFFREHQRPSDDDDLPEDDGASLHG